MNALFNDPRHSEVTEIEVTDPKHPLFGRRFVLRSANEPRYGKHYVLVVYRDSMLLRIPIDATNLAAARLMPCTKLTRDAITELVTLAEQDEVLCVINSNPGISGDDSAQTAGKKSSTNSRRSASR